MVLSFPAEETDFGVINALMLNLESIETVFQDTRPDVSVHAEELSSKANRCAKGRLEELGLSVAISENELHERL